MNVRSTTDARPKSTQRGELKHSSVEKRPRYDSHGLLYHPVPHVEAPPNWRSHGTVPANEKSLDEHGHQDRNRCINYQSDEQEKRTQQKEWDQAEPAH